ncbi:MAG TPA: MarR family transcriptional regulator [Candidatus Dormibacteraeota bacterium]|nr:MarR family transcriptional regulator [Candidatus Dormibacteraeota bacterium]
MFARIDEDGTRLTELAERAAMTKQSMGELVDDLVARGYLERTPDPRDARARIVRPTARGRRHLRDARKVVGEVEAELERRIGPGRARALREALREIAGAADR